MIFQKCSYRVGKVIIYYLLFVNLCGNVFGNEMPLEGSPASGLVVRNEKDIQIEREELSIRRTRIEVSYVFKNDTDNNIVTEVGFPIPPHQLDSSGIITYPIYDDLKIEVDGLPIHRGEITHAIADGKDVTTVLERLNISIKDFGKNSSQKKGFYWFGPYFNSLGKNEQKELIDSGLAKIDLASEAFRGEKRFYYPAWSVETTYHWTQAFPAKSKTSTKITYTPNPSQSSNFDVERELISGRKTADLHKADPAELFCLNDELVKWEKARDSRLEADSVDYILTTANHWKKPIGEFNLVIESDPTTRYNERASTCFESERLHKIDETRYEATIKDFVPKGEISVFFLSYPPALNERPSRELALFRCAHYFRSKQSYDGDRRYYKSKDLQRWNDDGAGDEDIMPQLCIKTLRNEIYARHGRIFTTAEMEKIFEAAPWYKPRSDFKESDLNEIEKKNIEFITEYEKKMGGWR
jgi:hypothetical protein